MTKVIAGFLSLIIFLSISGRPIFASTSTVSATVLDQTFNGPILITPTANALVNTTRPVFSWNRPTPLPASPLNHYDYYLDGAVFALGLSDSLTSVDFYFYTASASGGVFSLTPKTDLAQGYHTWSVTAYSDAEISASSETRTFYVDSVSPDISITNADTMALNWTTADPTTIPAVEGRYITVTSDTPLIQGTVEVSSNWKIVLICPLNIPSCTSQTYTANSITGLWEYRLSKLIGGYTYTVKVSATDAVGNSTLFPDFFLTYGHLISIPTSTPTPTVSPEATPSSFPTLPLPGMTLTPPPGLLAVITPSPYDNTPPISPTPPPKKTSSTSTKALDLFYIFLLILIILGLPLHLLMSIVGTRTPVSYVLRFLLILAFPFLRQKKYQTFPFTFIRIFASDKLDRPWQVTVTDINGYYNLKDSIPENIFISLSTTHRVWKDSLFKGSTLPTSCLYPVMARQQDAQDPLRKIFYDTRIVPLIIACLTSITAFTIRPSYPVLIYTYMSLQYLFSEYIYPKISKQ